jgi:hypothetical protein
MSVDVNAPSTLDLTHSAPARVMACSPPDRVPTWIATRKRLEWPNGAIATVHTAQDPEGLRGPQFDAAWFTEMGCAAVDKGTNEPNKFLDQKSSESSLPKHSTGARDDLIQKQYLRAMASHWNAYVNTDVSAARSSLQPLMLRYAFDAVERNGVLHFVMRDGHNAVDLDRDFLALSDDLDGSLEQMRDSEADLAGRVRVKFVQADANFEAISEEAVLAEDATHAVSSSQVPLSLTRAEGRQLSERWLTESRTARDMVRMALPLSKINVGAGDIVSLPADGNEGASLYRVDRIEHGASQLIEAVRIDPEVYVPSDISEELARVESFVPPVPVVPLFLDLPLITGDEVEHAPYVAAKGVSWPGDVAVYQSATDEDYVLNSVLSARSIMGLTQNEMGTACPAIIDHGADLQVKLTFGALSSITETALLAGGNLAAIGDGSTGQWEVFQFRDAEIVAPGTYAIRHRLRGQLGSDALMPDVWPENSWFVLLNGLPQQIDLAANLRNVAQNFLIGPARRSYDDPSYLKLNHAFSGNGLRPYAPVHLRASLGGGDHGFEWTRRTRFDGDDWDTPDVPLNEETEQYQVRVSVAGTVLREDIVSTAGWTYAVTDRLADAVVGLYRFEVAQVSARYGTGLFRAIEVA